jgi:hypothetical protein
VTIAAGPAMPPLLLLKPELLPPPPAGEGRRGANCGKSPGASTHRRKRTLTDGWRP